MLLRTEWLFAIMTWNSLYTWSIDYSLNQKWTVIVNFCVGVEYWPHMGSVAIMCLIHLLILAVYKSFACLLPYLLLSSLLIFFLKNRPVPFPGWRS